MKLAATIASEDVDRICDLIGSVVCFPEKMLVARIQWQAVSPMYTRVTVEVEPPSRDYPISGFASVVLAGFVEEYPPAHI